MALQGPLEGLTSHLHLERVFHLTSPVLVLHGLAWRPEHLNCLHQLGHRQDIRSSITFTALNLITSRSPFRATSCSSVWNRFPNHVPKCHLSAVTPPGTFPATRNMAEAPSPLHPPLHPMWALFQPHIRRFAITRRMAFVQDVCCVLNNPRKFRFGTEMELPTRLE